jgi:hypothetical protein
VNFLVSHVTIGHGKTMGRVFSRVGSVVSKWEFCMQDSLVGETSVTIIYWIFTTSTTIMYPY